MPEHALNNAGPHNCVADADGRSGDPPTHSPGGEHAAMELPRLSWWAMLLIGAVTVALLVAIFFVGWIPHVRRLEAADTTAAAAISTKPIVEVISPRVAAADETLLLPADLRPNQVTDLFARATGYLKPLPEGIDIGARVESGQLIAEIAAPDLDAELEQARAAFEQTRVAVTRAQEEYAFNQSTLARYESALKNRSVAEQDVEERRTQQRVGESAWKEAQATMAAAEAAVNRLIQLQSFEKIIAPFAGVITVRGYDAGALIAVGNAKAIFRIEQTDILRASINVPQSSATEVRLGQAAELVVRNFPGRLFEGTIARSSTALDPGTRTLRIEVDIPNPDGVILSGMYGQVRLHIHRDHPPLLLPTSALTYGPEGMRVMVLEGDAARYRPVMLGRDLGAEVEVTEGIAPADAVVNNPGSLKDGEVVMVRKR